MLELQLSASECRYFDDLHQKYLIAASVLPFLFWFCGVIIIRVVSLRLRVPKNTKQGSFLDELQS